MTKTTQAARLTQQDVERLKLADRFVHAGALSAALGDRAPSYGCHYGMRSTRDEAVEQFARGFHAAAADLI